MLTTMHATLSCAVLADPSPGTAGRPSRLAGGEEADVPLASLESQFGAAAGGARPSSAGFGSDLTNTGAGGQRVAARKPAVAPAGHPTSNPAAAFAS